MGTTAISQQNSPKNSADESEISSKEGDNDKADSEYNFPIEKQVPEGEMVIEPKSTANSPPSEHSLTSFFSANSAMDEISATQIPENSEFEVQIAKTVTET